MTRINSIEKSKGNSQALEQIAEDYLHLKQDNAGAVDPLTKKRRPELLQLARQIEPRRSRRGFQQLKPLGLLFAWT